MSDPYAQQPGWQQPQPPTEAPGTAYPAAPQAYPGGASYPPAQPYAQPYPAAQQYPTAQPYPVAQPYPPAGYPVAEPPRSGALGLISVLGTVAATVASVLSVSMMAAAIEQAAIIAQSSRYADQELLQQQIAMPSLILSVAGTIGFACWILAIVATATNRGRVAGIIGIVLGILAPLGVFTYFFTTLWQTIERLQ